MKKSIKQLILTGTCILGPCGASLIDETYAREVVNSGNSYQLEEITVSARKREESLQDAPISISAFTQSDLEKKSIFDLKELSLMVPNVDINSGQGSGGSTNAAIFIRGVGQNDFIFPTDPGVGTYIDGVYIARSIGGMLDLADVERIEVLRGPQGTLYGKNTIGGALNVVTSKPQDHLGGKIKVTTGKWDRIDVEGLINIPLIEDKLFSKIAITSKNQDGYNIRQSDGLDLGDTNLDAIRVGLNWIASETVDISLSFDKTKVRQNGTPGTLLGTFSAPGGLFPLYNAVATPLVAALRGMPPGTVFDDRWVADSPYKSFGTGDSRDENDTWGINSTVTWQATEEVEIKSITAYREMDAFIATDIDYSPFPIVETSENQNQSQFSQEIQFSGSSFSNNLTWLAGVYYLKEDISDVNQTYLDSGLFQALEAIPGPFVPLIPGLVCPAAPPAPCAGGAGNPVNAILDLDVRPVTALDTVNWASFFQLTYNFTDQFSLTLGGRYSYEKKEYFIDSAFPASGKIATAPTTDTQSWSKFTPKVGLDYHVNDDILFYASFSKGFKSGGWNPRPLQPLEFKRYNQENLTAYELGLKSKLLDNRMTFNIAGFYSQYNDLQLFSNSINPSNGSLLLTVDNAGDVDIWGIEAEIVARPLQGLDINAGIGFLDNKYTALNPQTGYPITNRLPQSAKWTLNAGIQYQFNLTDMGYLTFRGDISHRSSTFNDPQNTPEIAQGAFTLLNSRIVWDSPDDTWQLVLFAKNLTNKKYFTSAESIPAFGVRNAVFGRPREWGISLSHKF